jgi:hypothetical protein
VKEGRKERKKEERTVKSNSRSKSLNSHGRETKVERVT